MSPSSIVKYSSKGSVSQRFGIPTPIISYICKDTRPKPKVLLKLYSICKYFWPKFKVFPIYRVEIKETRVKMETRNGKQHHCSIQRLCSPDFDVYLFGQLFVDRGKSDVLTSIMSIWRIEASYCFIDHQILTLEEYKLLTENVKFVYIDGVEILRTDKSNVPLHELILIAPKVVIFRL